MDRRVVLACWVLVALAATFGCSDDHEIAYVELLDADPLVRADAARRLGDARALDGVESLIAVLDDPSEDVRAAAVRALGQIGSTDAVPALAETARDSVHLVRLQTAMALGEIASQSCVEPLAKLLYDTDETTRLAAARSLGNVGDDRALDELVRVALLDEAEAVRQHVVREIGRNLMHEGVPKLETALRGESDWVRGKAAEVLGMLGDVSSVPALIQALDDPYWKVRSLASHALGRIAPEDAEVQAALKQRLAVEDHGMTRVDIAWNLARGGDRSHIDVVRTLLFKGDPEDVRAEAARALGEIGDESDIALLERATRDKKGLVRKEASESVKKLKEA